MTRVRKLWMLGVIAVVVTGTTAGVAIIHQRDDAVGSSRRVTVQIAGDCRILRTVELGGHIWEPQSGPPNSWADNSSHDGRLDIVDDGVGMFTADDGTTVRFVNRGSVYFSDLRCPIR